MPEEKTEVAEGLDDETLAWLEDSEKVLDETEKKLDSGEIPQSVSSAWSSDNWQTKASGKAPEDIDI